MNIFKKTAVALLAVAFVASFAGFVYAAPSPAPSGASAAYKPSAPLVSDPSVLSGTLANGLSWRVARNAEPANRVFLRLVVRAGSSLEDDDQ